MNDLAPDDAEPLTPLVWDLEDSRVLTFVSDHVQSRMDLRTPDALLLEYTRVMMVFLLHQPAPRSIAMVGLGGGSLAKFCHRHLPLSCITVVEISLDVIALREAFAIPPDSERFSVLHGDAAEFFRYNKSKAKQATSRVKLIEKLRPEDVKPSSRQYPWIRFDFDEKDKLHRQAAEVEKLAFAYAGSERKIFSGFTFTLNAGDRVAVIGENGVGKSTFLKLMMGELQPQSGSVKWTEKARRGYYAQDHADDFKSDSSLVEWIAGYARANAAEGEDLETLIRGTLGRLLFSGDEVRKAVKVISGGEQGRMIFGKLLLTKNNVLVMDEPTNHLDMESIESLNTALEKFKGTLLFASHDREFVSSLATRILEIRMDGTVVDYQGNYEDYLASQGID